MMLSTILIVSIGVAILVLATTNPCYAGPVDFEYAFCDSLFIIQSGGDWKGASPWRRSHRNITLLMPRETFVAHIKHFTVYTHTLRWWSNNASELGDEKLRNRWFKTSRFQTKT